MYPLNLMALMAASMNRIYGEIGKPPPPPPPVLFDRIIIQTALACGVITKDDEGVMWFEGRCVLERK